MRLKTYEADSQGKSPRTANGRKLPLGPMQILD
jgi:hypothetical protein